MDPSGFSKCCSLISSVGDRSSPINFALLHFCSSMEKVLLWGALPVLPSGESFEISYKRSGNNLGNTLIGNGVASMLQGYDYIFRSQLQSPAHAQEVCSRIVIPAANFLWKSFDFGYMAEFIESTDLPVTMLGLGAQTHDRSEISEIHPNTLRLVKVVAERSPSIGVRGFYTAEVLAAHGVTNVEVLGCPSLYTLGRPPSVIMPCNSGADKRISVNFSRRVSSHSFSQSSLRKIENQVLRIAIDCESQFIIQDEIEEACISAGNASVDQVKAVTDYFSDVDSADVVSYFHRHSKYFSSYADWSESISRCGLSIGSRLHGNLVALLNGVPALTIVHDSRTLEMCALAGIPFLNILEYADLSADDILSMTSELTYVNFESNMRYLYGKMIDFLSIHGLNHRLSLLP